MALTVGDAVRRVASRLQDIDYVRWTLEDHYDFINEAQLQVALIKPESTGVTEVVKLVSGTKQVIPDGGLALLKVVRNMGSAGTTPGTPAYIVNMDDLDATNPDWHFEAPATAIENYAYDERSPHAFYVSPPVSDTQDVYVEVNYSKAPAIITALTDPLSLDDIYLGPIMDWCLYAAFSRDLQSGANQSRASHHYDSFYQAFGMKTKSDLIISPNNQ